MTSPSDLTSMGPVGPITGPVGPCGMTSPSDLASIGPVGPITDPVGPVGPYVTLGPVGLYGMLSYTCVLFVQIYVQTIYDMLRYPKL